MAGEEGAQSPHEAFWCYYGRELRAVRDRQWKLVFPHHYRSLDGNSAGRDGKPKPYKQLKTGKVLYDLKNDVGETTDVAAEHPEIVARLEREAEKARAALGDTLTRRKGSEVRPAGKAKLK
jgi:arylsulfatase A